MIKGAIYKVRTHGGEEKSLEIPTTNQKSRTPQAEIPLKNKKSRTLDIRVSKQVYIREFRDKGFFRKNASAISGIPIPNG